MPDKNPIDILRKELDRVLEILDELEKEENITVFEKEFDTHSLNEGESRLFQRCWIC